jgi:UDP-N-acetylmuramoyl-tripeptide--D-alanyl-D-alanine ligase
LHISYTAAANAQTRHLHTQIVGHYNLLNVLAAVAIGTHLGVLADDMQTAIETYLPANKRSQIIKQGSNTIILDAYNANPSSMQAALHTLATLDAPYKVAILGDMLEMGTHSLTEHQQIIAQLHQFGFNQVVLVGSEFAKADAPNSPFLHFATATDAQQWYAQQLFNHTYVLLKASRGIALEKVIETMD